MPKLLVIYNTCGIDSREPLEDYLTSIDTIRWQQDVDFDVAVSSCLNSEMAISCLKEAYSEMPIVWIKERWPVNATFNFSAHILAKDGQYDGIMYLDSGVQFTDKFQLRNLMQTFVGGAGKYSMVSASVDTDMGLKDWGLPEDEKFRMPLGKAVNCHAQIFSREFHEAYGGLLPDIFAGHCSESVLSFFAAAINSYWIHDGTVVLQHRTGVDKQSAGFDTYRHVGAGGSTWDHPFVINSVMERVASTRARQLGLGYEELRSISLHDPQQYDELGFAVQDELKEYIRDNLFLSREELPYDSVDYEVV